MHGHVTLAKKQRIKPLIADAYWTAYLENPFTHIISHTEGNQLYTHHTHIIYTEGLTHPNNYVER